MLGLSFPHFGEFGLSRAIERSSHVMVQCKSCLQISHIPNRIFGFAVGICQERSLHDVSVTDSPSQLSLFFGNGFRRGSFWVAWGQNKTEASKPPEELSTAEHSTHSTTFYTAAAKVRANTSPKGIGNHTVLVPAFTTINIIIEYSSIPTKSSNHTYH